MACIVALYTVKLDSFSRSGTPCDNIGGPPPSLYCHSHPFPPQLDSLGLHNGWTVAHDHHYQIFSNAYILISIN